MSLVVVVGAQMMTAHAKRVFSQFPIQKLKLLLLLLLLLLLFVGPLCHIAILHHHHHHCAVLHKHNGRTCKHLLTQQTTGGPAILHDQVELMMTKIASV